MKIYTKTGDKGTTSLLGGKRVLKTDLRIQSVGMLDEVNAHVGVVISFLQSGNYDDIKEELLHIQHTLFAIGAEIARPSDISLPASHIFILTQSQVTKLEKMIDKYEESLSPLKTFILPGGTTIASLLHVCRSITRRTERHLVALQQEEKVNPFVLKYINRLSDFLFVLARLANTLEGEKDVPWEKE